MKKKIDWLLDHPWLTQFVLLGICLLVAFVDQSGAFVDWPRKQLRSFGKGLGVLSVALAVLAAAYYPLREFYIRQAKRGTANSFVADKPLRLLLSYVRGYHPMLGMLACYSALLHGYFLWLRDPLRVSLRVELGLLTLVLLLTLLFVGHLLRRRPADRRQRTLHKTAAVLFFAGYIGHIFLRG